MTPLLRVLGAIAIAALIAISIWAESMGPTPPHVIHEMIQGSRP